jgi:PPK2 family polyphosphate:nucleotide phosphotransferase
VATAGVDEQKFAGLRVKPGHAADLARRKPDHKVGLTDRDTAAPVIAERLAELDELHNRLWAESTRSVLLVLQGVDAGGKDGTIRRVLSGLNPQGCEVVSFKEPTVVERAHDYLWRVHAACPVRGKLGVFNRSHYEDVLAARILGLVDAAECRRRYRQIRDFERLLVEEGTTPVKVCLHISKDEQRARLQERLDDPAKSWKFRMSDLDTRTHWDELMAAYEEALTETSTDVAPWYVVPADHKWVRDAVVAELLVRTFRSLDPRIPPPDPELRTVKIT